MRRTFRCVNAIALALAVVIGLAACADQQTPFEPEVASPEVSAPFFSHQPAPGFDVLRRTTPLARSVSITQTVGRGGGEIELEGAGIVLDIPSGALDARTEITITAPAGDAVAFTFSPHGLAFMKAATIRLDAENTTAEQTLEDLKDYFEAHESDGDDDDDGDGLLLLDAFLGVYFAGDLTNGVEPLEILQTFLDDDDIIFRIGHFSGYAIVGGRSRAPTQPGRRGAL